MTDKARLLEELDVLVGEVRRRECEKDLEKFVQTYLSSHLQAKSPVFHRNIYHALERSLTDGSKRVLVIAPRGFAKSTITTVFFSMWLALYKKRRDILIVSATGKLAIDQMRKIRIELENNEKLFKDFGDMKSDKWTEDHLILKNGVNIRAKGRGFQVRGFRPDIIICDDLEDEEVIYSKDQREKTQYWFLRTLMPTLQVNNPLIYIGTKLHQFSLIAKLEGKEEFAVQKYAAIQDGKSIWEDLWPLTELERLRRELGSYAFEAEYQNNPISLEEQPIKEEHIRDVRIDQKDELLCMAIDPAISEKETSDPRALVIFSRGDKGFREIHAEKGFWGVEEFTDKILDLYSRYEDQGLRRVVIEEVAFQRVFRDILLKKARERKMFLPISSAELSASPKDTSKRPKDKLTRLLSVVHLFEQRLVEVRSNDLYQELLAFPFGDHDDLVDATVYALIWLKNYQKGGFKTKIEAGKVPLGEKASYYVHEPRPGVFVSVAEPPKIQPKKQFRRVIGINYGKH